MKEGSDLIKEKPAPDVLDAGLISAAQHVEHYLTALAVSSVNLDAE